MPSPFLLKRGDARSIPTPCATTEHTIAKKKPPIVSFEKVVVRKEFAEKYPDSVNTFLAEYEASIISTTENPTQAGEYIVKYGIATDAALAAQAIPSCNIVYHAGDEMKAMMENFLNALGITLTEGDFYY